MLLLVMLDRVGVADLCLVDACGSAFVAHAWDLTPTMARSRAASTARVRLAKS